MIAGIEIARRFEEGGITTIHPLEVVVFLAEEPSPFGLSTIGSRGMVGKLSRDLFTSLRDNQERTLGAAILEMGGNPEKIGKGNRSANNVFAFLELHIEQGPILFREEFPSGW